MCFSAALLLCEIPIFILLIVFTLLFSDGHHKHSIMDLKLDSFQIDFVSLPAGCKSILF